MSEATLLLEARDVAKRFDSVVALKAASLQVRPGEVHGLMGANGAGKSTLVKIITGVFPADGGQVLIKGAVRSFRSPVEARRAGIVSVYQDPALVPDLTVTQNMRLAGVPIDAVRKWLAELGVAKLDFGLLVRDLPDPTLRLIDLARALVVGTRRPTARRNHGFPACRSLRTDLRDGEALARERQRRDLHFPPYGRGIGPVRPGDGFARWRYGRCDRARARQRGAYRGAHVGG